MEAFHCVLCNKNLGNSCSFAKHNKSVKHCLKAQSQPSDLLKRITELEQENKQLKQMNINLSETLVNITRISPVVAPSPVVEIESKKVKKVRPSPIDVTSPVVEKIEKEVEAEKKMLEIIEKLREEVKVELNRSPEEKEEIMLKKEAESDKRMLEEDAESHRRMLLLDKEFEEARIKRAEEIEKEVEEEYVPYTDEQLQQFAKEVPLTEEEKIRGEERRLIQKREKEQKLREIESDEQEAEASLAEYNRARLIRITKEKEERKEQEKQEKKEKKEKKENKPKESKSKRSPQELEVFESLKNKYPNLTSGDVNCIMKYKMDDDIDKMVSTRKELYELKQEQNNQNVEDTNNDLKFIFEKRDTDSDILTSWKEKNHDMIKKYGL